MDFVPLIDTLGERGAAIAGGAVIGALFGFVAQRSAFCTRSAVLDLTRHRDLKALATWAAGFAAAILGVQLLLATGRLDVIETRFFSTAQSLSGALIGGGLFGVGMVLARGCVSRLLVLTASGNLRALYSSLVVAIVGLATYSGVLVPLRDTIGGLWSTSQVGGNDILAHVGLSQQFGVALGVLLALAAAFLAVRSRLSVWRVLGGIGVGLAVVADAELLHITTVEDISYIINFRLKDLEARLDPEKFIRLSRGTLINLEMISHVTPLNNGTYTVSLKNNQELSVSRLQSKIFRRQFLRL